MTSSPQQRPHHDTTEDARAAALEALIDGPPSASLLAACRDLLPELPPDLAAQPAEVRNRHLAGDPRFAELVGRLRRLLPAGGDHAGHVRRELRFAILLRDTDAFNQALLRYFERPERPNPVVAICNQPFAAEWFATLPPQIQVYALHEIYKHAVTTLAPLATIRDYLATATRTPLLPPEAMASVRYLLAAIHLLEGSPARAAATAGNDTLGIAGWIATVQGDYGQATTLFAADLARLRREGRRTAFFSGIEGLFFVLAALLASDYDRLATFHGLAARLAKEQPSNPFLAAYRHLQAIVDAHLSPATVLGPGTGSRDNAIDTFCRTIALFWLTGELPAEEKKRLADLAARAHRAHHRWLASELTALLGRSGADPAAAPPPPGTIVPVSTAIRLEEPWQRALKALTATFGRPAAAGHQKRLAWFLDLAGDLSVRAIVPKEQKITRNNTWSRGRTVALKGVASLPHLSEQDRLVAAAIRSRPAPWGASHTIDIEAALPALVGHPHLYLADDPRTPVTLTAGKPVLSIQRQGDAIRIQLSPVPDERPYRLLAEAPYRYRLVKFNRHHRRIQRILGPSGLEVPLAALDKVVSSVAQISDQVAILSDFPEIASTEAMQADPRPHVHLHPVSGGLKVSVHVRPFGRHGPLLQPGKGPELVVDSGPEGRRIARRDLERERDLLQRLLDTCAALDGNSGPDRLLDRPEECLQLLSELQELGDTAVIEWPAGERLSVSPPLGTDRLSCRLRRHHQWFALEGSLRIDEELTIDLHRLLQLAARSDSRFIPLGRGQFLSLSNRLRQRLEAILAYGTPDTESKATLFHPLAALALAEEDSGHDQEWLHGDRDWQAVLARFQGPVDTPPAPPPELRAELRPYQVEGFRWLAGLAARGVGACLADDMGLGKTLQALALILHRAPGGPGLVIAPTSVCLNWLEECRRFAPTLRARLLGTGDRGQQVAGLGPFDLLVTSYTLLQQEAEILTRKHWHTIVLDEAQAIKNMHTKRSQTAMRLRGDFKCITTGTPLENHLGELWNLFNFINPGLLGTIEHFNERLAIPIERQNDEQARKRLRRLITPFVLRRLKSQVLADLPPRTEVCLRIEPSREEAALYEAVRRQAVARLADTALPPAKRRFAVLAEITRLRLASCHPRLIDPASEIPSSKLAEFGRLIAELTASRHKALVFSQFVAHLRLIARYLDERGICYQYLDGSTPASERLRRVNAFQGGEGDCFLISLRAGGLGLNLTAADYVILMDPWWNPAVEDQASDRAHRIGQTHPVTVYRLISAGTIEEKIMRLHREKRDLAEGLLAGTDVPASISTEELLDLLRSG